MSAFKLAFFNVKNNFRLFKFNIICMVFSIAVFLNFFSLLFNPSMSLGGSDKVIINATLYMTSLILIFFISFFILYSNSFFLKQRKREIGIYTFMGVDHSRIAGVFAIEQIILGVISLVFGLFFGIIFQKAFLMLLTKVAVLKSQAVFFISIKAIIITSLVFIFIFIFAAIKGFIRISRSTLIELLNSEKQEDRLLKTRYFTGIVSVLLIFAGYLFSRDIFNDTFVIKGTAAMFCIILGTFLLFSSFLSVVIKLMTSNKRVMYKGVNIISISNIAYRIRYNYRTLACISIIAAATITSIGAAFSVQHLFNSTVKIAYPYSFTYVSDDNSVKYRVMDTINTSGHKVLLDVSIKYLLYKEQNNSLQKVYPVIRLSDYKKIVQSLNSDGKDTFIREAGKLTDGSALSTISANDSGFKDNQLLDMYGSNIRIVKTENTPLLGGRFENNTIILTDNDYKTFKVNSLKAGGNEKDFYGILVSDQANSLVLSNELSKIKGLENNLDSYITYYNSYNEVSGIVRFTGLFLGLVFMLSTASIMYMKLISDAIGDRKKYEVLIKLGLGENELRRAVSKQVGLSYMIPLIVGSVYAFMAIGVLQKFLNKYLEISLLIPFLAGITVYVFIYICFYIITTRKFVSLVKA